MMYTYFLILISLFSSFSLKSFTMQEKSVQAVILAAGSSSRFKTGNSKLLAPICGQEMILFPVLLLESLQIPTTVVVGFQREKIVEAIGKKTYKPRYITQEQQLGTGHALLCTQRNWEADNILLLNGDMPLISKEIITKLISQHIAAQAGVSFIVAHNTDQSIGYGRLVEKDGIMKIIEAKHFTDTPEEYPLVNAGIFIINRTFLEQHLQDIKQNDITHEFYVTDLIELASKNNVPVIPLEVSFNTLHGVNTLQQLEKAERIKKKEITRYWMNNGVRFENPKTVSIDLSVTIEPGTVIGSFVELRGNTHIGKNCTIKSYNVLKDIIVQENSIINPYTH